MIGPFRGTRLFFSVPREWWIQYSRESMQACTVPKLWILQIPERLMLELSLVFASLLEWRKATLSRTHAYSCWDIHSSVYQWYRCHYPQFISIYIDYSFQHVWTFFFIPVAPISRFQVLSEKWINMLYSCLFTSIMFRCSGTAIKWGSQWSQAMSWHSHGSHEYHEVYGFDGGFKAESRGKAPKKNRPPWSTVIHQLLHDAKVVPPVVPEMHRMKAPFGSFPSSIRCLCTYI